MPAIEFRTGIDDKVLYACRWLRKAASLGERVRVIGPPDGLHQLDQLLWTGDANDFVAHYWLRTGGRLPAGIERTPLWLGDGEIPPPAPVLLLNLGAEVPDALDGYVRVVELVSTAADDVQAGRARWATYRQRGLEPEHRKAEAGPTTDQSSA